MFVQSILFAMLINSKEIGVNEGRQWDYLGSILQYQNILGFIHVMQHFARSRCHASDILVLVWCTRVTHMMSTIFAFCICYILVYIPFLNYFFLFPS